MEPHFRSFTTDYFSNFLLQSFARVIYQSPALERFSVIVRRQKLTFD